MTFDPRYHMPSILDRIAELRRETMVFGGPLGDEQYRYSTWGEAEAGHAAMVVRVKALASHHGNGAMPVTGGMA